MSVIPETIQRGKYTLKLLRDTNSGNARIANLHQYARFAEHIERQGYLTSKRHYGTRMRGGVNENTYVIYISTHILPKSEREISVSRMGGKMKGIGAISTNPAMNAFCQKARHGACTDAVCKACYSYKNMTEGKTGNAPADTARPALTRNTQLLAGSTLQKIPKITQPFFRLSAEGDLHNEQHLINFFAICLANPNTRFTIWTKRPDIVSSVLRKHRKPKNLHLILSSFRLNTPQPLPKGFDKVFTVYTPEYVKEHGIKINCGAKSCMSCKLCYTNNSVRRVSEVLKPNTRMVGKRP